MTKREQRTKDTEIVIALLLQELEKEFDDTVDFLSVDGEINQKPIVHIQW